MAISVDKSKLKENNLQFYQKHKTKRKKKQKKKNRINLPKINQWRNNRPISEWYALIILYDYLPKHTYYIHAFPGCKTKLERFSMTDASWFSYFSAIILVEIDTIFLSNLSQSEMPNFFNTHWSMSLAHTNFLLVTNYKLGNGIIKWFRKPTSEWDRLGFNSQLYNLGQITSHFWVSSVKTAIILVPFL